MNNQPATVINLENVFGKNRRNDETRLLGVSPEDTFARVKAHSVPGCCRTHDATRKAKPESW